MALLGFFLLLALSGLLALGVFIWCARLAVFGNWKQSLSILAAGLLAGLVSVGLMILLLAALGETVTALPKETIATIFGLGFSWGSFAMAVSLGLWPFVKRLVYQSRRWADRR